MGDLTIINVYKPPSMKWPCPVPPTPNHPTIHVRDFNCHHSQWVYNKNDHGGEQLTCWAFTEDQHLLYDAKDCGMFRLALWRKCYTPDLCFALCSISSHPIPSTRSVLDHLPNSQHHPTGRLTRSIHSIPPKTMLEFAVS